MILMFADPILNPLFPLHSPTPLPTAHCKNSSRRRCALAIVSNRKRKGSGRSGAGRCTNCDSVAVLPWGVKLDPLNSQPVRIICHRLPEPRSAMLGCPASLRSRGSCRLFPIFTHQDALTKRNASYVDLIICQAGSPQASALLVVVQTDAAPAVLLPTLKRRG
jgi:hypothetical protein